MIKSLSFNRSSQRPLAKELATHPTADKLLSWLEDVKDGSVLLLVSKNGSAEGPYVKSVRAEDIDMVFTEPSAAMRRFQQLLEGLLPTRDGAWDESTRLLVALLRSEEVRRGGVRRTEALRDALRALSQAQQKRRDGQGVALGAAPAGPPPGSGSQDEGSLSSEAEPGGVALTVLDMDQVWALAAPRPLRWSSTSLPRPPDPTADASNRPLVRRGQSFNLRRFDLQSSARKKGGAGD